MALKNNKSLGQHWLKDRLILNEIARLALPLSKPLERPPVASQEPLGDSSEQNPESNPPLCLEIGPGLGTLTSSLLKVFPKVVAVEFDPKLAQNLPGSFPGKNLTIINQDFLKFDLSSLESPYVVAANIPYYITSPIITKLLTATSRPHRIVLLIQKEVAERIVAGPGHHTYLSVSVQNLAHVSLGPIVGRELFTPPPKVDSQILILDPKPQPELSETALRLARIGFKNPRKKLIKNLPFNKELLESIFQCLGLNLNARSAMFDLSDWQKLSTKLEDITS